MVPQEILSDLSVKLLSKVGALSWSMDLQSLAPATFPVVTQASPQEAPTRQARLRTSSSTEKPQRYC